MSEYFLKPKSLRANVKFELELFSYATKAGLKRATGLDAWDFDEKTDLALL